MSELIGLLLKLAFVLAFAFGPLSLAVIAAFTGNIMGSVLLLVIQFILWASVR
jgi:hypothetical protein